jgi:hypothetical protein
MYEAKQRIITNDSAQYAEKVIQVKSLFREVPSINVRSSTVVSSYPIKFSTPTQFPYLVIP